MRDDIDAKPSPAPRATGRHSATTMYATTMTTLGGMNTARPCEISRRGARENSWTRSSARGDRARGRRTRAREGWGDDAWGRDGGATTRDGARRRARAARAGRWEVAREVRAARGVRARGGSRRRARGGGARRGARGAFEGFRSCD